MKYLFFFCITFRCFPLLGQDMLTLDEIFKSNTFNSRTVRGIISMKDGEFYTTLSTTGKYSSICRFAYESGQFKDTIMTTRTLKDATGNSYRIEGYDFSADENYILFYTDRSSIYRHSFSALFFLYHLREKKITPISAGNKIRLASFSPTGKHVAYVRNNNLFMMDLVSGNEFQISRDGAEGSVINGSTDWVYEEEFGFDNGFEWAPDGSAIAYYRFDESQVKEFSMTIYDNLYPSSQRFKYPKAGEKNAEVNLIIYHLKDMKNVLVETGVEKDQYLPKMCWTATSSSLAFIRLNRLQNKLELMTADATNGHSAVLLTESCSTYIDINNDLVFLKDNSGFIWRSELDGYDHLLYYGMDGKLRNSITSGSYDIVDFYGFHPESRMLYYSAAEESPMNKDIYCILLDGSRKKKLSLKKGTNKADFSSNFKWFINHHTDANSPLTITLHNNTGKQIRVLEDNVQLKNNLAKTIISPKTFFTIKVSDGTALNAWMIKPKDFNAKKKYPVLVAIYGGPGKNTVLDQWDSREYLWHQFLAQHGYIVVSVDNRGTMFRGQTFKKCTYGNLGKWETSDQIDAAKYLASLSYIDAGRIGIQGWSFGGYLSSLCITKGAEVFKSAIAVAPVTNWRYYDSIYTERFLNTPQNNPSGYDDNSPISFTDLLKGNYLLIHGTADDNVHFQHSAEMISALQEAGKHFELMIYPDKNHGISGGNARLHVYSQMSDFLFRKL